MCGSVLRWRASNCSKMAAISRRGSTCRRASRHVSSSTLYLVAGCIPQLFSRALWQVRLMGNYVGPGVFGVVRPLVRSVFGFGSTSEQRIGSCYIHVTPILGECLEREGKSG